MDSNTTFVEYDPRPYIVALRYVVSIVGVLANFLVAFVFLYNNIHKKSITRLLILHQSIIDLFGCFFFPVVYNSTIHSDIRGSILCRCRTIFFYFLSASTQNLLILTIERYIAVVHPRKYFRNSQSPVKRRIILAIPHVITFLTGIQLTIFADFVAEHPGTCEYSYPVEAIAKWSAGIIFLTFWLIPVVAMSYCYIRILHTLKERSKNASLPTRENKYGTHRRRDMAERNVITTLLLIFMAFIITLTPNVVYYSIHSVCNCLEFETSVIHDITVLLNALNLTINPFIYAFKFRDFKVGFKVIVRRIRSRTLFSSSDDVNMTSINHGISITNDNG
ncbi:somatostatin receptor type 1-like [Anneissia japonica]|uniref:somatostatin receptor type 1-like n=1 Tax=Anneissia japonica TaxID=1529436 RepID=UPI001425A871|nr:somatostatin receptor type 1-like [Anneissia japonica]